jgi:hypothetical protein
VVIANLDPTLPRREPADDVVEVLAAFPYALTTAEVAAVMCPHLAPADVTGVQASLIAAAGEGSVERRPIGDGSLWSLR